MNFDLLWGNDIISQGDKSVKRIFDDLVLQVVRFEFNQALKLVSQY